MKNLIKTERLIIRKAENIDQDVDLYHQLWTDPDVTKFVGFPKGLRISKEMIREKMLQQPISGFDSLLLVEMKENGELIGEAKLGFPNKLKISKTDIKLLPKFWKRGFGKEIKLALVDYIFKKTYAVAVEGSPNKKNIASIRMQKSIGAKKISKSVYHFPESMRSYTEDVHCVIYYICRK